MAARPAVASVVALALHLRLVGRALVRVPLWDEAIGHVIHLF